MKKALITLNLILFAAVVIISLGNFTAQKQQSMVTKAVETKSSAKNTRKNSEQSAKKENAAEVVLLAPDAAAAKIVEKDVFNQIRSPLAYTRAARSEMTLVGVVDGKAAIIKSNTRQRQFNPYLAQAMRMSGNMRGQNGGGGGRFTQWSQMSNRRNNAPVQQYVRVGETMNSGYVLVSVSRGKAILERGNDKLELELQDPSKNRTAARQTSQRLNSAQQFQQAQMYMQSQMIRTMREIQQNSRNNAPQGNRNRR